MLEAETRQSEEPDQHSTYTNFIQKYGIEFKSVPPHLRQRVAYLIDLKVENEV